jgi:hypothetical protein
MPGNDWSTVLKSTVVSIHHFHDLPLCGDGEHNPSCRPHGPEISCVRVIKGIHDGKIEFGASCVHLFR